MSKINIKSTLNYERLTPDNACMLFIDHQTGLMPLVNDMSEAELKNNLLALAKAAKDIQTPSYTDNWQSRGTKWTHYARSSKGIF
jgi:nicotinamidase-related amidase